MAITTFDGAGAGQKQPGQLMKALSGTLVAGRPLNPWYLAGVPGAAVAPAPGLSGAALTSYAGQIAIPAASANTHLFKFSGVSSAQGGTLLLCDRLWHNSGLVVTTTTAQTVNSVAFPARDTTGTSDGKQVLVGLEISAATGAGAATPSISYTNDANVASRTSTTLDAYVASSAQGTFYRLGLQAGDTGVRSIQTCTLGVSMTSGSISLVAYRIMASLELPAAGLPNAADWLTGAGTRFYDTSVPFLIYIPQTTTTTQLTSNVTFTQG
jgi:hypothetical protein